ncbi:hypothetical protein V8C26DRAFT_152550 [Trichoderma gracile]
MMLYCISSSSTTYFPTDITLSAAPPPPQNWLPPLVFLLSREASSVCLFASHKSVSHLASLKRPHASTLRAPCRAMRVEIRRRNTQRSLQYESHPPQPPLAPASTLCRMAGHRHVEHLSMTTASALHVSPCPSLSKPFSASPSPRLQACLVWASCRWLSSRHMQSIAGGVCLQRCLTATPWRTGAMRERRKEGGRQVDVSQKC